MLYYVASPYSKYERGITAAFEDIARACGTLTKRGINVFSPIVHTHPIAIHGDLDPYDHKLWLALDSYMMKASDGIIVVMMPGWADSKGVTLEIDAFKAVGKPIRWFSWPELVEVGHQ